MTDIKLPLERWRMAITTDEYGDVCVDEFRAVVDSDVVSALERAYAELQERYNSRKRWRVMTNPRIKEIVTQYLKANGYDGLYNEAGGCGCELADLFACGGTDCDCRAGYKVPCDPEDCPNHGNCAWHIAAECHGQGTRIKDLKPGEDWAAKHCEDDVETGYDRAFFAKTQTAYDTRIATPDTSERDFRRALVAAIAGGVASDPECHEINEYWVCDTAKEIADEQLRRERSGK